MNTKLELFIKELDLSKIDSERKIALNTLRDYIQQQVKDKLEVNLSFICTHNSRRSQFSQVLAQSIANFYKLKDVRCYSGGTEVTAVYNSVIKTLTSIGFIQIQLTENSNPIWALKADENATPIICFSKVYNNIINPKTGFAAIMTCSSADTNCPIIPNATRISLTYTDPKYADGTEQEEEAYSETCRQIATEMKFIFSQIIVQ